MYAIGIDISAEFFTATCLRPDFSLVFFGKDFPQDETGFDALLNCLVQDNISSKDIAIIMENTGVYSERISHYFHRKGILVYIEPAQKIKKAFHEDDKDDDIDSQQIGEYYFRFNDKIQPWKPRDEVVEDIAMLLSYREQVVRLQTACKNSIKALRRKERRQYLLEERFEVKVTDFNAELKDLDKELRALLDSNPSMKQKIDDLLTIKHLGILLALNLLVVTEGFTEYVKYTTLARYLGVYPIKHKSGKSIRKRKKSDGIGPERIRKLLYLAAMRFRNNNAEYKQYYERKFAEGKNGRLILNNIENKILRLVCGVLKSGKPYIDNYRSVNPGG